MELAEETPKIMDFTQVNLNAAADTETELYVCPENYEAYVIGVLCTNFSAACGTAVVTFGETGGTCDEFLGDTTLTNISGTNDSLIAEQVPSATPPKKQILNAGDSFGVEITTAEGSALTCDMAPIVVLKPV
jgi:hypothetical protein